MTNPFIIDVRPVLNTTGLPENLSLSGNTPLYLGSEMMGIAQGSDITINALLANIGSGVMLDAQVSGQATIKCTRCLRELSNPMNFSVSEMFAFDPDFVTGEQFDEDDPDDIGLVEDDTIDITQAVVDAAGLDAAFNPVCEDFGQECDEITPAPDGISGEKNDLIDPRWAGLAEKFASLDDDTESAS